MVSLLALEFEKAQDSHGLVLLNIAKPCPRLPSEHGQPEN